MPIGIGGVAFEGPYTRHEMLGRRPGVFAVLDGRNLPPLHAEKTDDIRRTVEEHARRSRWQEACDAPAFAVFYTSVDRNQRRVERAVREEFDLYGHEEDAARTNGRPAAEENGRPAGTGVSPAEENRRPAAMDEAAAGGNERPAVEENGRPAAGTNGRDATEEGEPSSADAGDEARRDSAREGRSFHFHVPADPVDRRRARVS